MKTMHGVFEWVLEHRTQIVQHKKTQLNILDSISIVCSGSYKFIILKFLLVEYPDVAVHQSEVSKLVINVLRQASIDFFQDMSDQ